VLLRLRERLYTKSLVSNDMEKGLGTRVKHSRTEKGAMDGVFSALKTMPALPSENLVPVGLMWSASERF
jgi:hypothetical protein